MMAAAGNAQLCLQVSAMLPAITFALRAAAETLARAEGGSPPLSAHSLSSSWPGWHGMTGAILL